MKNQWLKLQRVEETLLFLTLLFLPTQLGKHFWPNFSYIYSLKIDYLSPTVYFWDLLVVGLISVWLLRSPKISKSAINLFLFFLLTQSLSLIGAESMQAGLVRLEQYWVAALLGIYLASLNFKDIQKKIYLPLVIGIIGESLFAVLQFLKGSTLGFWVLGERAFSLTTPGIAKFDFYGRQFLRPYATFPHPNVLAGFILLGIWLTERVLGEKRKVVTLSFVLGSTAIFLTMSRAAILAGVSLLLLNMKKRWIIWTFLVAVVISPILYTRFSSLLNFDNLTILRREELVENAWQIFLTKPFLGIGLNNFILTMAGDLLTGPNRFLQPVHNIFLLTLAETGVIGLIGFVLLIGYPFFKILKIKDERRLNLLVSWFIILFLGLFDHYFLTLPQGYRLLFLIWGISLSAIKRV